MAFAEITESTNLELAKPEALSTALRDGALGSRRGIEKIGLDDLRTIWSWNSTLPKAEETCVHDLIAQTTRKQPEADALCAWDGQLTYNELDKLSTDLAQYLVTLGVGPELIVPLCFEKSLWTPVAMLAVMRAGGASILLDPSQPEDRLRTIMQQVKPTITLSSADNEELTRRVVACRVDVVSQESLESIRSSCPRAALPEVKPWNKLYVVYTSGSTGKPKGVIVTHSNFCTAVRHQQPFNGHLPSSRCFDFAPYAFDAAWSNFLHTLTSGGCLCIPSDADRRDRLAESMESFRVTIANLTPSLASLLPSETIRKLQTLVVGGEALPTKLAREWSALVQLKNGYGPSECTPTATLADVDAQSHSYGTIGRGVGIVTWVVRPDNGEELCPIGHIGELWIEGPLVGPGYLCDPEKTSAAFIEDPPWLLRGAAEYAGRHGRLYKTGDLVCYNNDGTLTFIGRADTQVKIRGQRVELSEVEHHVSNYLAGGAGVQVAAEVISLRESDTPIIVVFLQLGGARGMDHDLAVKEVADTLHDKLATQLPGFMLPTAYVAVQSMPMTATVKLDRQRLREIGRRLTPAEIAAQGLRRSGDRAQATAVERQIQMLWASTLGIDADLISLDDSFMRIGGDSLKAMKLAEAAREQGLNLTVMDIFRTPQLSGLAETVIKRASLAEPAGLQTDGYDSYTARDR